MTMRSKVSLAVTAILMLWPRNHGNFFVALAEQLIDQPFGSQNVGTDEYKWFTSVRSSANGEFLCSGFLVGKSHVITAAHCVDTLSSNQLEVEVGYYCLDWNNCRRDHDYVGVERWDQHESGGDMAILTLDEPVSFGIQPAVPYLGRSFHPEQKYMKNKKKGRRMELVGAGRTGLGEGQSFYVKKTKVVLLEEDACRAQVNPSLLTSTVICSVPSDGNPCQGDSGSAVVVPGKEQFAGRDVVMAVHFKGRQNCDSTAASKKPILHFRLEDASGMIRRVICEGSATVADWCPIEVRAEMLHTLTGHTNTIPWGGLSFNSDGSRLLSSSADGTNKVWDVVGGGPALATFAHADGVAVWAGRFHPVADYFASGSHDDSVMLWKLNETDAPYKVFTGHNSWVDDVSWSPCGTRLASASGDKTIKVWSVVIGDELLATLTGHTGYVRSVTFDPYGTQLASSSADGMIKLWDATTNSFNLLQTLTKHTNDVVSVSYSPDGMLLASVSVDETAKVWDVKTGKVQHDFREHTNRVVDVAWSPKGRLVATASWDGTVRIWDTWNGGSSVVALEHSTGVWGVAWSPDGSLLAAGLRSPGNIVIWRITSG